MDENGSKAKILVLIPAGLFLITVICLGLAFILEGPTHRGVIYSILAFIGLMGMILSPFPCFVLSVVGTVFAVKELKDGMAQSRKYLILGILELLVHAAGMVVAVMLFNVSMGV